MKAKMMVMKMLALLVLLATAAGSLLVQAQMIRVPALRINPIPAATPPSTISTPPPIPSNLPTSPIFPPPIDSNLPSINPTPPGQLGQPNTPFSPPVDPTTLIPPPVDPRTLIPPPVDPRTLIPPPVDPSTLIPPPAPGTPDINVPPPNPESPPSPSVGRTAAKQALCAASCGFQCGGVGGKKNKTTTGFFGRFPLPLPRIPRIPFLPRPKPKPTPSLPKPTPSLPQPTPTLPKPTPTHPQPTPTLPKPTPTLPHPTPTLPIPGAPVLPFPTPPGFRPPKIPPGVATAACYGVCMTMCNAPMRQTLNHCTTRCAYNSITHHSVNTEDADEVNKHVDSCRNKCQKNSQAFESAGLDIEKDY